MLELVRGMVCIRWSNLVVCLGKQQFLWADMVFYLSMITSLGRKEYLCLHLLVIERMVLLERLRKVFNIMLHI
jgi:hypothetical protein